MALTTILSSATLPATISAGSRLASVACPAATRLLRTYGFSGLPFFTTSAGSLHCAGGALQHGCLFSAMPRPAGEPDREEHAQGHASGQPKYGEAGYVAPHISMSAAILRQSLPADLTTVMHNPVYSTEYVESVQPKHLPPATITERLAFNAVQAARGTFDWFTGYGPNMTEAKWLQRILFLETVAGVPGMVAGMLRHLKSLRSMAPDQGWINTLLDEAENERMHLLTFMQLRKPGPLFRGMVILAQGVMFNAYFLMYLASPKTCHAFVGYLEEEAVKTYTHALQDIDAGKLWNGKPAPDVAKSYWQLSKSATMRDLILAVRADEACHSHVNHTFARIKQNEVNPFGVGAVEVP